MTSQTKGLEYDASDLYPNRNRLSSSQIKLYERNPRKFYLNYVMGVEDEIFKTSQPIYFGKVFAAAFEDPGFDWRAALDKWDDGKGVRPGWLYDRMATGLKSFPDLPVEDCEVEMIADHNDWEIRATLDGYHKPSRTIIENKTGKSEWTQERVDTDVQLTIQAWAHWKATGELPGSIHLNWLSTAASPKRVVTNFKTNRDIDQLEHFTDRIDAVINGVKANQWHENIYS